MSDTSPKALQIEQPINVKDEYKAFVIWAKTIWPHNVEPPSATTHIFDAWMGSARHARAFEQSLPVEADDQAGEVERVANYD